MARPSAATGRDPFLDYLRGLAIVWVILVHVFYHKPFFPFTTVKSYILFEMPLIFFVSGASLFLSHRRDPSLRRFVPRRFERLLAPYVLLGAFSLALYYGPALARGQPLEGGQLLSWLTLFPAETNVPYIALYMWFMRVMVVVSFLHILLVRAYLWNPTRLIVAVLLVGLLGLFSIYGHDPLGLPQMVVFYSIFLYWGYSYAGGRFWRTRPVLLAVLVAGGGLLLALLQSGFFYTDMQSNKFPPNLVYAVFGLVWLTALLLCRNALCWLTERFKPAASFLLFFGEHSYAVYLWHGVGFWLIDGVLSVSGAGETLSRTHYAFPLAVYFFVNLPLSALLAVMAERLAAYPTALLGRAFRRKARVGALTGAP